MSRHWIRRRADWKETLGAGLLATGVAAATFYLTRVILARDPLPEPSRRRGPGSRDGRSESEGGSRG